MSHQLTFADSEFNGKRRKTRKEKQAEVDDPVPDLCREHGISTTTFYKWRTKFGDMDASLMARLKELEGENRRLKKCMLRSASRPKSSPRP